MPKYSFVRNPTFTIDNLADDYKNAFDTLGWGTGLISIQGGYRFTASQATDTQTTPIKLKPDGTVTVPTSITNITAVNWVDNYNGKNLVLPSNDPKTWMLAAYMPGVKQIRINYTVLRRLDNGSTGNFSDINFYFAEQRINTTNSSADTSFINGLTISDPSWGTTYTVGNSYTTLWTNEITMFPVVSIRSLSAVLRIDSIDYQVTPNRFGVQSKNLDNPLFEFRFNTYTGNAYASVTCLPIKNAYTPIVMLIPPEYVQNVWSGAIRPTTLHVGLYNLFREGTDYTTLGVLTSEPTVTAVLKNYSLGASINLFVASNNTYDGFYLKSSQSGSYDCRVQFDKITKQYSYPATPVQITNRSVWLTNTSNYLNAKTYSSSIDIPNYFLIKVTSTNKVLTNITTFTLYSPQTVTGGNIYSVTVDSSGFAKKIIYQSKVLSNLVWTAQSPYGSSMYITASPNITLTPGYYVISLPNIVPLGGNYWTYGANSGQGLNQNSSQVIFMGGFAGASGVDTGWVANTTQINYEAGNINNLTTTNNTGNYRFDIYLNLNFDNNPTPSQGITTYGEGTVLITRSPDDVSNSMIDRFRTWYESGQSDITTNTFAGVLPLTGIDLAVNTIPLSTNSQNQSSIWYSSSLPGNTISNQSSGGGNPAGLEFSTLTAPWDAWLEYKFRTPLTLINTKIVHTTSIAPGNSIVNTDSSEDIVLVTHTSANPTNPRSTCFRVLP